jgi:hypothetical protein
MCVGVLSVINPPFQVPGNTSRAKGAQRVFCVPFQCHFGACWFTQIKGKVIIGKFLIKTRPRHEHMHIRRPISLYVIYTRVPRSALF